MNNNIGGEGRLCVPVLERIMSAEAVGDYTLPDYRSEIRRILRVTETVLPPTAYVSSDSVEWGGTVDYQVLYVGADGGIYSAPLSGEYSFSVPLEKGAVGDDTSALSVLCDVYCEGVSARVSAPRRLSLRCRLKPLVRIYSCQEMNATTEAVLDENVMQRWECVDSLCADSGTSDIIDLSCVVASPSEEARIAAADGYVTVSSAECVSGGVFCRGKVTLRLLLGIVGETGEENYTTVCEELPFEAEADIGNCDAGYSCRAQGVISSLTVEMTDAGAECAVGVIVKATAFCNQERRYLADAYSLTHKSDIKTMPLTVRRLSGCGGGSVTVSERLPLEAVEIPDGAKIITSYGRVMMDKCVCADGKATFGGNASFTLIWHSAGETGTAEVHIPVRYECPCDRGENTPVSFSCRAEATDIRASVEQGELRIDSELCLGFDRLGEVSAVPVRELTLEETLPLRSSELVVCYPDADDTLWSVAKRYNIPAEDISGDPQSDRYVIIK